MNPLTKLRNIFQETLNVPIFAEWLDGVVDIRFTLWGVELKGCFGWDDTYNRFCENITDSAGVWRWVADSMHAKYDLEMHRLAQLMARNG
jgi:hypothetical protein